MTAKQYRNMKQPKQNKYHNKHAVVDGHSFDSRAEARYYNQLKLRKRAGDIQFFRLQPKYQLMAGFEKDGVKHRAIHYIADFEIHHKDGSIEVVDVKGTLTQVFRLKEKMFHKRFPHKLTLVKWERGGFVEI